MNFRLEIFFVGGDGGIRTLDPQIANLMLSQLSYVPNARDYKLCPVPCQGKILRIAVHELIATNSLGFQVLAQGDEFFP